MPALFARGARAAEAPRKGQERIAAEEHRVALVIGNNDYRHIGRLDNAVADARAFKREMEERGFSWSSIARMPIAAP